MAERALAALDAGGDAPFYKAKLATARFFMRRMLPETAGLALVIQSGATTVMDPEALD
jgi:hypothetical protein